MSLYSDLTEVLTPYANRIKGLNGSLEDLEDSIESKSLSSELKLALMNLANNVSWVGTDGSAHIEALRQALYPQPPTTLGYVTKGLMALWDGINNTGNGHDSAATEWTDLISGRTFVPMQSIGKTWSFGEESVVFAPTVSGSMQSAKNCIICPYFGRPKTVEICMKFGGTVGNKYFIGFFTGEETDNDHLQILALSTDVNTIITYNNTADGAYRVTDFNNIHGLSALYPDSGVKSLYLNGTQLNLSGNTGSYSGALPTDIRYKYYVIGGHPGYTFKGEIYSIRLYNRVLTADEIAANHTYDMSRFSMGE